MNISIPKPVREVCLALKSAGFDAYLVGGCVRDLILTREPKDWDVTTNARPEAIQEIFPDSFYENDFGTVGVKTEPFLTNGKPEREHDVVEVTTYRTEFGYSDNRRPDEVRFSDTLEEDLMRRDFTMNAIALDITSKEPNFIDPYNGREAIDNGIIRTVRDADERFSEDALRMMRAIRFHSELGFKIEEATYKAIQKHSRTLNRIAKERVRIELERIILSERPAEGVEMLRLAGLLEWIMPELLEGVGVTQNLHHIYTVWEHNLKALETCPSKKLAVRLAALLHDVAKPRTKRGEGKYATFYNHDHVGARMTKKMLEKLKFPRKVVEKATLLVDQHLFYYNVDEVTEAAVRRIIKRVGLENIKDLIDVRIGDRLGSGVPKAKPYRLRHFEYMIDKVSHNPVSVKSLKINGNDLIAKLSVKPGPTIGAILDILLGEVIDDPSKNTPETLLKRAKTLAKEDIKNLRDRAKARIEKEREEEDALIKQQHWVK